MSEEVAAADAGIATAIDSMTTASVGSAPPVPAPLAFVAAQVSRALCSGGLPMELPHVNECEPALGTAVLAILLAPLLWNLLGRLEFYTGALSGMFLGRRSGCVVLAAWIFLFSLYRDALVLHAIRQQPTLAALDAPLPHAIAGVCALVGGTFVLTSFARLGLFGTYLGDYFGILMEDIVTGFPFNVVEHPMYDGSTLLFLSMGIMEKSPAGIAIAVWVFIVYRLACIFEGPFTSMIYAARDRARKSNGAASKSE